MKFKQNEVDDYSPSKKRGNKHRERKRKGTDKRDAGYFDTEEVPVEEEKFRGEFKGEF